MASSAARFRQCASGLVILGALFASGCGSVQIMVAEGYDPRVPLRVAVLPFVDRAAGDDRLSSPLMNALDLVPILSDDGLSKKHAADVFRIAFVANLERTPLNVVDTLVVDSALTHRGLNALLAYDGDREVAARQLGEALGADAVVFGEVLEWDRSFYLVESIVRAGLKVEMRDTTTGAILFAGKVHDAESSGISKVPIDFDPVFVAIEVVGESLRGLRNTIFADLSNEISRQIVTGLSPSLEERTKARPPSIRFVAHSASGPLSAGDDLVVVAVGSPDAMATFRVGNDLPFFPMTETAPGSYLGSLRVSSAYVLRGETLTVRLLSRELAASTMTLGAPRIFSERD